jgi:colanic acid biosynthesis glycosyl transferase WcaI
MRVLYLTQWFDPEPVQKGIAFVKGLAAQGHEVRVVTGFPNYPGGKVYPGYRIKAFRCEAIEGVTIDRLLLYPSHDRSAAKRAVNYLSFFLSSLIYGLVNAPKYDVVYVYHPPITPALAASLFCGLWGKPFVIDIQDLWPDSVGASGITSSSGLVKILGGVCRYVYRRAAVVMVQSQGFRDVLIERGVPPEKLVTVYNWAEEDAAMPAGRCDLAPYRFQGRFNFVYAGNLGRAQALEALIEAAVQAGKRNPDIQLLLIGDGVDAERLRAHARKCAAVNVNVMPAISKDRIADVLDAADVLALHLSDKPLYRITIPSKVQFYMAVGKPILVGVRGECADLVTEAGAGLKVAPQDPEAIAEAMVEFSKMSQATRDAMGKAARRAYDDQFSFAEAITKTDSILKTAVAQGRA